MTFPWRYVRAFKVESCANGQLRVTVDWNPERVRPYVEGEGGGPGLGLRLEIAQWVEQRLRKRGTRD